MQALRLLLLAVLFLYESGVSASELTNSRLAADISARKNSHYESEVENLSHTSFDVARLRGVEDTSLDMRPSKIEPTATDEEAEARFDFFRTEPHFRPAKVLVKHLTEDRSRLAPGYYFIAPYWCGSVAPQIFDHDGQLIYWGVNEVSGRVKNFSPCSGDTGKLDHLCWSETFYDEWNREYVRNRVFDETYSQVGREFGAMGGIAYPNSHEFNMLPDGNRFIQVVYDLKSFDLSAYGGPASGWVYDGCFQEVDMATGDVSFSWCATSHFQLGETNLYLDIPHQKNFTERIAGSGTFEAPWDFIHINSVDKTPDGNYIVSARHFSAVIQVAGLHSAAPGQIMWQLGGKSNDFKFEGNFSFARQHHARFLYSDGQRILLSLLNNGFHVRNPAALEGLSSSGQIIRLDTTSHSAKVIRNYVHPDHSQGWRESVAIAEGSMDFQRKTGGGVVIGWGSLPDVSEFAADGSLLFHASIANHTARSYRAWKKPWVGKPHWPPALVAFTKECAVSSSHNTGRKSPLFAHVSWNGATEVVAWRFSVSVISQRGPWHNAGTFAKQGFETQVTLNEGLTVGAFELVPYVRVEALDLHGHVLGETTTATFVPLPELDCTMEGCAGRNFTYDASLSMAGSCAIIPRSTGPTIGLLALATCCIMVVVYVVMILLKQRTRRPWWTRDEKADRRFGYIALKAKEWKGSSVRKAYPTWLFGRR